MEKQDRSIRKKSSRIVTNPQKLPVPSKAKPILKKHGKPLSKNQGKYQAKKNHKSFSSTFSNKNLFEQWLLWAESELICFKNLKEKQM